MDPSRNRKTFLSERVSVLVGDITEQDVDGEQKADEAV